MSSRFPRCLVALLILTCTVSAADTARRPPNVLFILADDLGYGDASCYGQGKIKTPAIDKLAAEGARLTDGYVTSSTCTPTRYAILTGEYAWRKKGTGILPGDAGLIISPSRTTVPRIFKNAGYTTGAIGKWHLGLGSGKLDFNGHISPGLNELGFDYSFNMPATGDRVPCVYMENGRVVNLDSSDPISVNYGQKIGDWPTGKEHPELLRMKANAGHADTIINGIGRIGFMTGGKAALWVDQTLSDNFNVKALEFIKRSKDKPFFLYYAAHEPHVPRDPNPRFVGKSGVGARGDAVLQFDDQVAKLMKTLKEEGLEENTLVILTSDNGPAVSDGYADGALETEKAADHHAAGIYRGGKYTDFEGGVRMPFIVRWPGHIKAGAVISEPVCATDLAATAAALTGQKLAPDAAPDSFDILPVLTSAAKTPHDFLLYGNPNPQLMPSAIREGNWKLIQRPGPSLSRDPGNNGSDAQSTGLLFDLAKDPREQTNVAAENPEVVARLKAKAAEATTAGFTRPGGAKVAVR